MTRLGPLSVYLRRLGAALEPAEQEVVMRYLGDVTRGDTT